MSDYRSTYLNGVDVTADVRRNKRKARVNQLVSFEDKGATLSLETEKRLRLVLQRRMEKNLLPELADDQLNKRLLKGTIPLKSVRAIIDEIGFERGMGLFNNILSIEFFEKGLERGSAVGRIDVAKGVFKGTGFLVGEDILLTNHHVLMSPIVAQSATFTLNAESNQFGVPKREIELRFSPDRFWYTNEELDCTFVAVKPKSDIELSEFGFIPLDATLGKVSNREPVSLIQHPAGEKKSVVVHDSNIEFLSDVADDSQFCNYTSDTKRGSSGSPVFNTNWDLVALHQRSLFKKNSIGQPLDAAGELITNVHDIDNDPRIYWYSNQGIRISFIVNAMMEKSMDEGMSEIRKSLISLW